MISVKSRDGRKGIGFQKEMEDTELEEGEASYDQIGDDSTIDPDVALSYIDEKIQDVLGHFQKDFEGGVSAENLGAKFGGYGSFLPTYARSPAWSHQRTSSEVNDCTTPKSPKFLEPEASHRNSLASSGFSLSMMPVAGSTATAKVHASHTSSVSCQVKRDARVPYSSAETSTLKGDSEQKPETPYNQRTLKVRIKVGTDNLPTRKNAEIYSGLGLDGSPSSSLEDSYTDSEGLSHDIRDAPDESPMSILKVMTSFLLHGSQLLSPLSDEFVRFTEKEKHWRENVSKPLRKGKMDGYNSKKGSRKHLPEKKPNAYEKGDFLEALNGDASLLLKRETDLDSVACDKLVSDALKLPLLTNMQSGPAEGTVTAADFSGDSVKGYKRDRLPSDVEEEQPLEPEPVQEIGRGQKSTGNISLLGNTSIIQKENCVDKCTLPNKPGRHKGQKNIVSLKVEPGVPELGRALNGEITDPMETKVSKGGDISSSKLIANHNHGEEKLCGIGRNKSKGGQPHDAQIDCLLYKRNRGSHASSLLTKSHSDDTRKNHKKNKDRYQEFFGDLEFEQDDNEVASKENSPSAEKLMDSGLEQKDSTLTDIRITKEKFSVRKSEKPSKAEEYSGAFPNEDTCFAVKGPKSDATTSAEAPEKESWVQCEKCLSWRLLPLGTDPKSLPDKWLCTMLNWLPAMNRCTVSEEETTLAVRYNNQVSALGLALAAPPGTHCKPPDHPGNNLSVVSSADGHHMIGQQASFTGGKKKNNFKDGPDRLLGVEPAQVPKSLKKNHHAKHRTLNSANHSPFVDEYGYQHSGQSSSSLAERRPIKQTQKKSLVESYSAGGDTKSLKVRKRGQSDSGSSRGSKKVKSEDAYYKDEKCISAQGGDLLQSGHCLSNNSPYNMPRKDRQKSNGYTKDFKGEIPNYISATEITSNDASLPIHKCDSKSSSKKKKVQGDRDTYTHVGHLPTAAHHSQDSCEMNERKEKKARTSKSEGKDPTTWKTSSGTGKRAREMDQPMGQDRGSSGTARSLKKDLSSVHPSAAATSSSSKVSGSCKIKNDLQEVKGSPVESVSSSPLRVSSTDKYTVTSTNPQGKDDKRDGSFLGNISPRRFSDGEHNGGNDQSVTLRKRADHRVNCHGSVQSPVVNLQDKDLGLGSGGKIEEENRSSSEFVTHQPINDAATQGIQYTCKSQASDKYQDGRRKGDQNCTGGYQLMSENGSSSRSNNGRSSISENGKIQNKIPVFMNGSLDGTLLCDTESIDERSKFQEKFCPNDKDEKNFIAEKGSGGKDLSESNKSENQSRFRSNDDLDIKENAIIKQDVKGSVDSDFESSSKKLLPEKSGVGEVLGRGKSHSLPPSARYKKDKGARLQLITDPHKENGAHMSLADAHDETLKSSKQNKKGEKRNENALIGSGHLTPTMHKLRDQDGAPVRKDSSSNTAATSVLKEAKDLKHLADRIKNSESNESTGIYFQAALKFLSAASLLESGSSENNRHNEIQSTQIYSSTAKLCEFCAHEYERSKDMAAAALAYKCMEVAFMRVIYSSHGHSSRDRHELQMALQIVPSGESPSSSASDVDNLNNPASLDKVSSTKGIGSPQVAGNHGITARNRSSLMRLLNFAQDVNFAMEAARKSRSSFAAVNLRSGEAHSAEGISSVKRALDFNFQDVDGLLRLVRIAMDAISR